MLRVYNYIRPRGVTMLGPNCPGALSPGKANVGIIPAEIFSEGSIGLVSRSGTLTYQIGHELTGLGLGNSTIVGIGGDPIVGSSFIDILAKFEADPETEIVVMVGEIGGDEEEKAARYIAEQMSKPVVGVHRRLQRAARQDDGPRRRDHHRLVRHRARRRRRRSRRPASASARRRPRRRRSPPRSRAATEPSAERLSSTRGPFVRAMWRCATAPRQTRTAPRRVLCVDADGPAAVSGRCADAPRTSWSEASARESARGAVARRTAERCDPAGGSASRRDRVDGSRAPRRSRRRPPR